MGRDLSTQQQKDFPEWVLTEGAWLVFARDDRPGWTHVWPTTNGKPEGLIRSRTEAEELVAYLKDKGNEVVLLRVGPATTKP